MSADLKLDDLNLKILKISMDDNSKEMDSCYELYKAVWGPTYKELDNVEKLMSDEFFKHDFMSVIFHNEKAVSLICYSHVNMKVGTSRDNSWFKAWPETIIKSEEQTREGTAILAALLAGHPDYRKSKIAGHLAQLNIYAFSKLVLESFSVGYGTCRNSRSVNAMAVSAGAVKVGESYTHASEVDLVFFEPHLIKEKQIAYSIDFKNLWRNRTDYRHISQEKKTTAA